MRRRNCPALRGATTRMESRRSVGTQRRLQDAARRFHRQRPIGILLIPAMEKQGGPRRGCSHRDSNPAAEAQLYREPLAGAYFPRGPFKLDLEPGLVRCFQPPCLRIAQRGAIRNARGDAFRAKPLIDVQVAVNRAGKAGADLDEIANLSRISRVVPADLFHNQCGIDWPVQGPHPEVPCPQTTDVPRRYHLAESLDVTKDYRRAHGRSFEGTAALGENEIVVRQQLFRCAHLIARGQADSVHFDPHLATGFCNGLPVRIVPRIVAEYKRAARDGGQGRSGKKPRHVHSVSDDFDPRPRLRPIPDKAPSGIETDCHEAADVRMTGDFIMPGGNIVADKQCGHVRKTLDRLNRFIMVVAVDDVGNCRKVR